MYWHGNLQQTQPEPSGSGVMNDGRTIVYVNDSVTFNNTGLQTDISLVDIAFGTAHIAVVYEAAGSTCSIRTETTVEGQLVINWSCFHFQVSACACTCIFTYLSI